MCPPETFDREISADLLGKKRQGKKGKEVKIEKKRRKIVNNGKVENWKWKVGKLQNEERIFFFFFLLVTFQNHSNLFWVYQNGNFLPGISISHQEKKSGKMTLPPQKNFPVMPLLLVTYQPSTLKVRVRQERNIGFQKALTLLTFQIKKIQHLKREDFQIFFFS